MLNLNRRKDFNQMISLIEVHATLLVSVREHTFLKQALVELPYSTEVLSLTAVR
jgi:hypothetical protein